MDKDKQYIYYRESAVQSVISDTYSFGILGAFLYVNHMYLGDHVSIAILLLLVWLTILYGKATGKGKVFTNKKDLIDYLNKTV